MDRARRTAVNRRKTMGASASPQSNSDASLDHRPSASPVMAHATNTHTHAHTPQTAPQGRRANKSLQQAFTFSTPAPNRSQNLRKRSKTMDDYSVADEDFENGSPKKGGHSLRKRARVDYTLEQIDDAVEVPNSTASRNKKRKSEVTYGSENLYGSGLKRRGASVDADTPSSRRRNPARKTSEMTAYKEEMDEDENDVQDTIEVGVPYSDCEKSDDDHDHDHDHMDHSNISTSDHSNEAPQKPTSNNSHQDTAAEESNGTVSNKEADSPTNKKSSDESLTNAIQGSTNHVTDNVEAEPGEPKVKFRDSFKMSNDRAYAQDKSKLSCDTLQTPSDNEQVDKGKLSPVSPTAPNHPFLAANSDEKVDAPEDHTESEPQPVEKQALQDPSINPRVDDEAKPQSPKGDLISSPTQLHDTLAIPMVNITEAPTAVPETEKEEIIRVSSPEPITKDMAQLPPSPAPEPTAADSAEIASAEVQPTETTDAATEPASSQSTQAQDSQEKADTNSTVSEPVQIVHFKPQPTPVGRWAHLTPYLDGEFICYPEKKSQTEDEAVAGEDQTSEDKDTANDMEPMVDDIDDMPDVAGIEAPTPALNTPIRGSPVPESVDPTVPNSPAPGGDDGDEVDVSESQEPPDRRRIFRYRKVRNPEEYISAIENFEDMPTTDLYELLDAINLSLVEWQHEWTSLGKIVDDYENSLRRRAADSKYESRTRNFHQHGINYEEPEFAVKGYKAKDKDVMSETRYLQGQDRVMAAAYGFEYDPHPSKIGRQNPQAQQSGIMTRGRSLRNQPKPTAKATEADEVTGKRQRKPVQVFDTATQDVSRSSTPVPPRGRRRRTANENDDVQPTAASSFNGDPNSDGEGLDAKRRKRIPRQQQQKVAVPSIVEDLAPPPPTIEEPSVRDTPSRSGRRARIKQPVKYDDDNFSFQFVDEEPPAEPKPPKRRHILTLKIPRGKNFSEPSSAITDNGDSRPSTASSESSSHTAESSYSFRPKRQKRFRDDPDEEEEASQAPKKRTKRGGDEVATPIDLIAPEAQQGTTHRKIQKIKVVRTTPASRKGTPSSLPNAEEGDEPQKDYKSMTKSEKMSASMKSRWANGNMAGAVEKRKATLAAKKAAQAAADQRGGLIAPKLKATKPTKKESNEDSSAPSFSQNVNGMSYSFHA
ncbi:hypothetical protein PT974_05999 [Cladobotryum mycophilum]|uniref:Uncharacterized protein n=1 Tax=Cladobotryum mycophilum TaxID=491253 RepID=A0ABR0SLE2_9HYPO